MKIGILSDTHNVLPKEVFDYFKGVQYIVHAGDIGGQDIVTDLESIAPVFAVYGNMDSHPLVSNLKRIYFFKLASLQFCLTHIIRSAKSFAYELFKMNNEADIVIYGHTHLADKTKYGDILFINPGSASSPKHGTSRSVAILTIEGKKAEVDFFYY
jgi:putative phosphoesterase